MQRIFHPRENWYRDVLILIIAGVLVWSTTAQQTANHDFQGAVQQSRYEATRINCVSVNERHDATLKQLRTQIDALSPARKRRAQANIAGTVALIDALAPYRDDCAAYARQIVALP